MKNTQKSFNHPVLGETFHYDCDEILLDIKLSIRKSCTQKLTYQPHDCCVAYSFFNPVLFLVASTVYEGIIQGASYDLVKTYVRGGLDSFRTRKLLRQEAEGQSRSASKTEILFGWKSSSVNGNKRRDLHFSIKREHRWASNHKRLGKLKSVQSRPRKYGKDKQPRF